jgi:hypothetical protein
MRWADGGNTDGGNTGGARAPPPGMFPARVLSESSVSVELTRAGRLMNTHVESTSSRRATRALVAPRHSLLAELDIMGCDYFSEMGQST